MSVLGSEDLDLPKALTCSLEEPQDHQEKKPGRWGYIWDPGLAFDEGLFKRGFGYHPEKGSTFWSGGAG